MKRPALALLQHGLSRAHLLAIEARLGDAVLRALDLEAGDTVLAALLDLLPVDEQYGLHQRWSARVERRAAFELPEREADCVASGAREPGPLSRSKARVEYDRRVRDVAEVLARVVVAGSTAVQ